MRHSIDTAAAQALAARHAAGLVQYAPDAVVVVGVDGTILLANGHAERLFGYDAGELVGAPVEALLPARFAASHVAYRVLYSAHPRQRSLGSGLELRGRRRDGGEFPADISLSPIATEQGMMTAAVIRDVTRRKQAEEALRQAHDHLEAQVRERTAALEEANTALAAEAATSARAREEVAALNTRLQRAFTEAHHRIKNHLQIVAALVDLQRMEHPDTVPSDELARLGGQLRTLAVVHDLLTVEPAPDRVADMVSVQAILERLLTALQQAVVGRSMGFRLEDASLPSNRAVSLALLANELATNALKHGRGCVDVTFSVEDGRAELVVCDDGEGFPEGFDPAAAESTGVALVESLARVDLRGETRYWNRPTGGAGVTVTFPLEV